MHDTVVSFVFIVFFRFGGKSPTKAQPTLILLKSAMKQAYYDSDDGWKTDGVGCNEMRMTPDQLRLLTPSLGVEIGEIRL